MGDLTKFERPQVTWICGCGCSSFYIREDGQAECCLCGDTANADGQGWYDRTKDQPARDDGLNAPIQGITGNGSIEFVRLRVAQLATDESAVLIVVARENGSVSTWSKAENQEQVTWVGEKLDTALSLISKNVAACTEQ